MLRSFQGIGDAAPGNVNRMMAPHILRLAETRAKARALRDAVNVGEALADDPSDDAPEPSAAREQRRTPGAHQSRPGKDATAREWFTYLSALADDHGIAVPPTPGPGVTDEAIIAENKRLKALIQEAQQARQGGE